MKLLYLNYMPSAMNKDYRNLSKPSFGCCFYCNLVNLKRLMTVFWSAYQYSYR